MKDLLATIVTGLAMITGVASSQAAPVFSGADISSLPDIERAGGKFYESNEEPATGPATGKATGPASDRADRGEIRILRDHGCQLFRVRLFVNPDTDYGATGGATQDLATVIKLAKRIKSAGGSFLLDLHYSDTWADPKHQITPHAWEDLDFDSLNRKVGEYTASVMNDLQHNGASPDMVQVGNEITGGMLWPTGKIPFNARADVEQVQWRRFTSLVATGANAVRASQRAGKKIPIMVHIDAGGKPGKPQWFFEHFMANGGKDVAFDVIGLSFYPAWKDSIAALKKNMAELATKYDKDIVVAETAYSWDALTGIDAKQSMQWPQTPAGQRAFLLSVRAALAEVPGNHGLGFIWWYPDSIPVPQYRMWRSGNEALFDHSGHALPALAEFKPTTKSE